MKALSRITPRGLVLGLAALLIVSAALWFARGEHDEAGRAAFGALCVLLGFALGQEHEHEKARRRP